MGDAIGPAMARAAFFGAGIMVRHHHSPIERRSELAQQAQALGAPLAIATDVALAKQFDALFVHNPLGDPGGLPVSLSVHDEAEAAIAAGQKAALVFVSPVYATTSHPEAIPLGEAGALQLARLSTCSAIALGGLDFSSAERLMADGFAGWAGIDCWLRT